MQLQQIRYMIAIAEEQNITKAAEKMFISQSAMSQQLLKVERELGTALFERDGRILELTKAGQIYINAARAILNVEKAFYEESKALEQNSLPIKIAVCTGVPQRVFDKLLEAVCAKLTMTDVAITKCKCQSQEEWEQLLYNGDADIVMGPGNGQDNPLLHVWEVTAEEFVLVIPANKQTGFSMIFSPPGSPKRKFEKEAVKKAKIRGEGAGTTEIPAPTVVNSGQAGIFLHDSEVAGTKRGQRILPGFSMEFCACSLKENRICYSFCL